MASRILIVDDEPLIVKGLKYSLEQDQYETDYAQDGEEALEKFFQGRYDLVLLDVMLPKIDGIEVCQRIREKSTVPIIMLTAKGEDMDKILGLEYGADDYMTKPFNILEVKARGAEVLALSFRENRDIIAHADDVMFVPKTETFFSEAVAVIPLQLLAYYVAKANGCDIDKPRNLAKSVTVE